MISNIGNIFELEPMKYWAMPTTLSKESKQEKLSLIVESKNYIFSEKKDGNLIRAIITPSRFALQTRGRGVNSGEFGDIQNKVFWSEDVKNAFNDVTILLGEAYIDGGTDKTVGAILRSLDNKAISRQSEKNNIVKYYIFDVLAYNGEYFFDMPIIDRIKYLPKICSEINNEYVSYASYYEVNEKFWDRLNNILTSGGEGTVLYKKTMLPCEGRTKAWDTIKVKQELKETVDAFIIGIEPPKMEYTGKEPQNWKYWKNTKLGILLPEGNYYSNFIDGESIIPVTKYYYFGLPGALICGVYDKKGNEIELCKVSNLTDELAYNLKTNFSEYDHKICTIDGMLISQDRFGNISIRHPKLIGFRNDIDIKDCTLDKLL